MLRGASQSGVPRNTEQKKDTLWQLRVRTRVIAGLLKAYV